MAKNDRMACYVSRCETLDSQGDRVLNPLNLCTCFSVRIFIESDLHISVLSYRWPFHVQAMLVDACLVAAWSFPTGFTQIMH